MAVLGERYELAVVVAAACPSGDRQHPLGRHFIRAILHQIDRVAEDGGGLLGIEKGLALGGGEHIEEFIEP